MARKKPKTLVEMGAFIAAKRKEIPLLQEQLAELMGLSRPTIIAIEQGKQRLAIDKIWLLCCILHIEPNDLFPKVRPKVYKTEIVKVPRLVRTMVPKKIVSY